VVWTKDHLSQGNLFITKGLSVYGGMCSEDVWSTFIACLLIWKIRICMMWMIIQIAIACSLMFRVLSEAMDLCDSWCMCYFLNIYYYNKLLIINEDQHMLHASCVSLFVVLEEWQEQNQFHKVPTHLDILTFSFVFFFCSIFLLGMLARCRWLLVFWLGYPLLTSDMYLFSLWVWLKQLSDFVPALIVSFLLTWYCFSLLKLSPILSSPLFNCFILEDTNHAGDQYSANHPQLCHHAWKWYLPLPRYEKFVLSC